MQNSKNLRPKVDIKIKGRNRENELEIREKGQKGIQVVHKLRKQYVGHNNIKKKKQNLANKQRKIKKKYKNRANKKKKEMTKRERKKERNV